MKKRKSVLILLVIFLVLCCVYAGLTIFKNDKEKEKKEKEEASIVYVTDLGDIEKICYDIGNGEMEFEKEDGNWFYTSDRDFPLSQTYPEQIAHTFGHLKAERELKDGDTMEAYGLTDPSYKVTVMDTKGNEASIYYGDSTSEGYYVTVDDTRRVFVVSSASASDLQYSLEEMAQLDVFPSIGSGNLKEAAFTDSQGTRQYSSSKSEDTEAIAAIAGGLGAVTLSKVADYSVEEENLPAYGLHGEDVTTASITYTKDDEDAVLTIYMGSTDGHGNRYVMINNSKIVYMLSEEICSNILYESENS